MHTETQTYINVSVCVCVCVRVYVHVGLRESLLINGWGVSKDKNFYKTMHQWNIFGV